jgi:hypothetical protein
MTAWELSSVAALPVASLAACWALNGWKRGQFWPRRLRGKHVGDCGALRAHWSASRRRPLDIRPLPPDLRAYYTGVCRTTEAAFGSAPRQVIHELDLLVREALRQCGYPVDTFEHNLARILPTAPQVVEDYRTAHAIALANDSGIASEPDLRLAMFHYHELLKTLLDDGGPERLTKAQR